MHVSLITPKELIFDVEASFVSAPGGSGSLGILDNHSPLVTNLKAGEIIIRQSGNDSIYKMKSGILEVAQNKVSILCDHIEKQI